MLGAKYIRVQVPISIDSRRPVARRLEARKDATSPDFNLGRHPVDKFTRTWAILIGLVVLLGIANRFSVGSSGGGGHSAARALNAPAQPSPSEQAASRDRLRASTYELEQKYRDLDVFRSIRGKSNVMVGAAFFQVDFGVKSQACAAVSQARSVLGLSRAYALHEPMNGRAIGYYNGERLSMD